MARGTNKNAPTSRPDALRRAFGEAVRRRRAEPGVDLTRQALADRAGITAGHLAKLEKGRVNPTLGTMRRLAAALGLSLRELLVRTEALIAAEADDAPGRPPST